MAAIMAATSSSTVGGMSSTSLPASSALTHTEPHTFAPFITSASVNIKPLKPISFFSKPFTHLSDMVAGILRFSSAGTLKCPVSTPDNPALTYCLKGSSSTMLSSLRLLTTVGMALCESTIVEPWPGKCFATDSTPPSSIPFENDMPWRATASGLSP